MIPIEHVQGVHQRAGEGSVLVADTAFDWQVETEFSTDPSSRTAWDKTSERLGSPVYMTYDWLRTWWRFYGRGKELRLFKCHHLGEIVAQVPMYVEQFGYGPFRTRVARLVGANIPPKTFDPPVDAEWASRAVPPLIDRLLDVDGCALVVLGPVSEVWSGQAGMIEVSQSGALPTLKWKPIGKQTVFELPTTFDAYLESLSRNERKGRSKQLRRLEREHNISSDVIQDHESVCSEFLRFADLHATQWRGLGKSGHFDAWPHGQPYNLALVDCQAKLGRVRFYRFLVDGEVASCRYTFCFGNTLFSELPARKVGLPWDRLGIGAISLLKFHEQAIQQGIKVVDSGIGVYAHKTQLGGKEIAVGTWRAVHPSLWKRSLAQAFLCVAQFLNIVFGKIWHRRIAPRLPKGFARTQRLFWLRFQT